MYSALLGQRAHISHLLKFVGDHGESLEDGVGGASDGHNSLRAVSLRDVDSCPALEKEGQPWSSHSQETGGDALEAQPFLWVVSCLPWKGPARNRRNSEIPRSTLLTWFLVTT